MRAAPRPEAVAVLAERQVDERLHGLQQRLLDQSVQKGRCPQLAHSATRFRYANAPRRLRPVAAVEQSSSDVGLRLLEVVARLEHRASVDSGTSLVGLEAFPRSGHVLSDQRLPEQVTGPAVRLHMPRQRCFIAHGVKRSFTAPMLGAQTKNPAGAGFRFKAARRMPEITS